MTVKVICFVTVVLLSVFVNKVQCGPRDWWKNAVFYQIYPRSFKDSNNDGIGDLNGIRSKLDHLVDLGVSALWMSPIYKSPGVDHGYDISDFRDIDPIFGNLDDFKYLVQTAHAKGLKVIMDFVPNHSSDEHEWFRKSVKGEEPYNDFYVWANSSDKDTPPNNWISYFHGSAWEYNKRRKQYYLHQFHKKQPDLNYRNPCLVQQMKDILKYWMNLGVDGFRIDIISALFEAEGYPNEPLCSSCNCKRTDYCFQSDPFLKNPPKMFCTLDHIYTHDQPETYDMMYQWRELVDDYTKARGGDERVLMTESYSETLDVMKYYGDGNRNGAHFTFNFWFITQLNETSSAKDFKHIIDKWFAYMPVSGVPNWVLGNHDQHRVATRYGPQRADALNMLILALPGVAITYNGEEIGMEDGEITWEQAQDPQAINGKKEDFHTNGRDFERTPYHWDDTTSAGFSTNKNTWLPVSNKYRDNNLEKQKCGCAKTSYNIYKSMVKLRNSKTMKYGDYKVLALSDKVLALKREYRLSPTYLLVINLASQIEIVCLDHFQNLPETLSILVANSASKKQTGDTVNPHFLTLAPYEAVLLGPSECDVCTSR